MGSIRNNHRHRPHIRYVRLTIIMLSKHLEQKLNMFLPGQVRHFPARSVLRSQLPVVGNGTLLTPLFQCGATDPPWNTKSSPEAGYTT